MVLWVRRTLLRQGSENNLISIIGKELRSIAWNRRQIFTSKDQVCQELVSVIGKEVVFISGKELGSNTGH